MEDEMTRDVDTIFLSAWNDEACRDASALVNSGGGMMCIGYTGDGKAVDVESPQLLVQTIRNDLLERCNFTEALITTRRVWMKSVVDVVLPSHPYTVLCDGEVFVRKDSHTIVAQGENRKSLMADLFTGPMDSYPVLSASFEDLDQNLIEDFVITADPDADFHDTRAALMKLLDWDGKAVTRALAALFHPAPATIVPGCMTILSYDRDAYGRTLVFDGPLADYMLTLVEDVPDTFALFRTDEQRKEDFLGYEYDPDCYDELVINALMHRDMSRPHPVTVTITDSCVEVRNACEGDLMSVEQIRGGMIPHGSICPNPTVARAFKLMGLCALDGISLEVIDDTLDFNGQPPLEISVDDDGIMTARMGISEDPANFDNTDSDILAEIPWYEDYL